MDLNEAIAFILNSLVDGKAASFGYDVYPEFLADLYAQNMVASGMERTELADRIAPVLNDASWELTRRGYLRPGPIGKAQTLAPYHGYSLTASGRNAVKSLDLDSLALLQPGSLSAALGSYRRLYGESFFQRSQEALKCRNAEAWLACCAMAGAAGEAIMLTVALAKTKDEDRVRKDYNGAGGRQKISNLITGHLPDWQKNSFKSLTGIISHWRDEAAHGAATTLTTANADDALRQLLNMCQWTEKYWAELTT